MVNVKTVRHKYHNSSLFFRYIKIHLLELIQIFSVCVKATMSDQLIISQIHSVPSLFAIAGISSFRLFQLDRFRVVFINKDVCTFEVLNLLQYIKLVLVSEKLYNYQPWFFSLAMWLPRAVSTLSLHLLVVCGFSSVFAHFSCSDSAIPSKIKLLRREWFSI